MVHLLQQSKVMNSTNLYTTTNNSNPNDRDTLFYIDYVYRTLHTLRLVRKFWSKGVVKLPTIDMRTHKVTTSNTIINYY